MVKVMGLDCEALESLYSDLADSMGDLLFDPDFFASVYRELLRVVGGYVPDCVRMDTHLLEIFGRYLDRFDRCELIHAVVSASHFHPCDAIEFLRTVKEFFKGCDEIFFYPLEQTVHVAVLFGERAISFPSGDEDGSGYLAQLAGMCGVRMDNVERGRCAYLSAEHEFDPGDLVENFENVVIYGRYKPKRFVDLDRVVKVDGERAIFLKPGGAYSSLLKEHPLFYPFIIESGWGVNVFQNKVPLGEIARLRRLYVRRGIIFRRGEYVVVEDREFPEKGWLAIETENPVLIGEVLTMRVINAIVDLSDETMVKSVPVPIGKTDEHAEKLRKEIEKLEREFLGI